MNSKFTGLRTSFKLQRKLLCLSEKNCQADFFLTLQITSGWPYIFVKSQKISVRFEGSEFWHLQGEKRKSHCASNMLLVMREQIAHPCQLDDSLVTRNLIIHTMSFLMLSTLPAFSSEVRVKKKYIEKKQNSIILLVHLRVLVDNSEERN